MATALVATIALTYLAYLSVGGVVGVDEVSEVAVIGLVTGWASRVIGGRKGFVSARRKHVALTAPTTDWIRPRPRSSGRC